MAFAAREKYDDETEAKLDEWVAAKRARDFTTSDAIQAELEAQGVDTHVARPDPRKGGGNLWGAGGGSGLKSGGSYDQETEAKLDQWVQAKRARDFTTSDAIQAELEAQGVDPKTARPDPKKAGANSWGGGVKYDRETEARLDEWVQAKRARDFETSDAIQAELEAQGVDTKLARPDPRKGGANLWGGGGGGGRAWSPPRRQMPKYDKWTEAKLDEWVQAKRSRDFTTSDAIQLELEAQGVDPKSARPDPKKGGGGGSWDVGGGGGGMGGGGGGGGGMMNNMMNMAMMSNMMNMMMMKGGGGKGSGKGKWGPY